MTHAPAFIAPPPAASSNDRLLLALFLAALVHAVLILAINFTAPAPEKINQSIDITLVNIPTEKPPEKANYLAPENQQGAGENAEKSNPLEKKLPSLGDSADAKPVVAAPVPPNKPPPAKPVLTQRYAERKTIAATEQLSEAPEPDEPHRELSPEALAMQIAQLGQEIRTKAQGAEQTRIKFINSVSAHKYLAAQYIKDWEIKVERVGNLNYPEAARKKGFTGKLTMDVGIKPDGSVYSIRVARSSGYPALDEAAKRIVRMSAPFATLPKELLQEVDILVISRVWEFSDESGLSSSAR
jgi:protein TonB